MTDVTPIVKNLYPFGWEVRCAEYPRLRTWAATEQLALAHFWRALRGQRVSAH